MRGTIFCKLQKLALSFRSLFTPSCSKTKVFTDSLLFGEANDSLLVSALWAQSYLRELFLPPHALIHRPGQSSLSLRVPAEGEESVAPCYPSP